MLADALAAAPVAWEREDFGNNVVIAGTDGWTNGYDADQWYGTQGVAATLTDHNATDDDPDAWRNWLIRGPVRPTGRGIGATSNSGVAGS